MRRFMKKQELVINGFAFWSRGRYGLIFARQLEPTKGLFGPDGEDERALLTPILVGRDGEEGHDLADVLAENEKLKRQVEELQAKLDKRRDDDLEIIRYRVDRLERPWWNR
jgi:hypothetical protein